MRVTTDTQSCTYSAEKAGKQNEFGERRSQRKKERLETEREKTYRDQLGWSKQKREKGEGTREREIRALV